MDIYNYGSDGYYGWLKSDRNGNEYEDVQGRGFDYVGYIRLLETKTIMHRLKTIIGDEEVVEDFYPSDFTMMNIGDVADKGFDVNSNNLKCFNQIVQWSADDYLSNKHPLIYKHLYVGWDDLPTCGTCFKYQNIVFDTKKYPNFKSTYGGTFNMQLQPNPAKQLSGQIAFIKKYVEHSTELSAALAIGASAVVNGYISEDVHTQNIIAHYVGTSSTGKTTAAQVSASVACCPHLLSNSLFTSWNSTKNGILGKLKANRGCPIILDELSEYKGNDISKLIYDLVDGKEKTRCDKTGAIKPITKYDVFRTTIVTTGETSIFDKCSKNSGLDARIIELSCRFTKSAKEADEIKSEVMRYYGYIAPCLAQYMLSMDKKDIVVIHEQYKEQYAKKSVAKGLESRIANSVAVILTAARLMNDRFKINLDIDNMMRLFLESEKTSVSLADKAYDYLMEKVSINEHHFVISEKSRNVVTGNAEIMETPVTHTEVWGKIDKQNRKIYIFHEIAKKMLKEGNFESSQIAIREMRETGYLEHEKGRSTLRISMDGMAKKTFVVIKVHDDVDDEPTEQDIPVFQPDNNGEQENITDEDFVEVDAEELQRYIDKCNEPFKNY